MLCGHVGTIDELNVTNILIVTECIRDQSSN